MMFRTHAATGALFGLAIDAAAAAAGHPLPAPAAAAFPVACGYCSAVPDVDHHNGKIRFALPPARWLFLLARFFVGLSAGAPCWRRAWFLRVIPYPALGWSDASRRRMDYWLDHRHLTHTIDFAFWLGLAVELPLAVWQGFGWWLLAGPAVTVGCLAHRAGDRLTKSGVPAWSWRLDDVHKGFYWLRTGHWGEHAFVVVQYAAIGAVVWVLAGTPDLSVIQAHGWLAWHALPGMR